MVPIEKVLLRLGEKIEELIGPDEFKLLKVFEGETSDQQQLVDIVLNLNEKWELLRNKKYRNIITDSMEAEEVKQLAFILDAEYSGSPYKAIRLKSIRKNSAREELFFGFFGFQTPEIEVRIHEDAVENIEVKHGLYPHQRNALLKVERILEQSGRVMLHMPTGSGKTRTAMNLISKHLNREGKGIVLWLAHSEELCEQAVGEFKQSWRYLGDREIKVRRFFKSHSWQDIDDGLVVAGLSKMWHYVKDSTELAYKAKDISLIVFDEAHQSLAETFQLPIQTILVKNKRCKLLGLSATPGRTWNDITEDRKLSELFNGKKVGLEIEGYTSPLDYLISEGYLSKPIFNQLNYPGKIELTNHESKQLAVGLDIPKTLLDRLSLDGLRNFSIVSKAEELTRLGHKRILIFAINVKHAKTINSFLKLRGVDSDVVTGETESDKRKRIISKFKQEGGGVRVLCNFGVLTTGFDAPKTSAAIISRPTKSLVLYSQMVGRVIRGPKVGGTKTAEVWTVVDTKLPGFGTLADAFSNWEDVWSD